MWGGAGLPNTGVASTASASSTSSAVSTSSTSTYSPYASSIYIISSNSSSTYSISCLGLIFVVLAPVGSVIIKLSTRIIMAAMLAFAVSTQTEVHLFFIVFSLGSEKGGSVVFEITCPYMRRNGCEFDSFDFYASKGCRPFS